MLQKDIEMRLAAYQAPFLDKDLASLKAITRVGVDSDKIQIDIALGYPYASARTAILADFQALLGPLAAGKTIAVNFLTQIVAHMGKQGIPALPQVKNIIAVGSGKGGVGKSTVSINLALALAKEGANVGILDADIYGPSQPAMLGATGQRPVIHDRTIQPIQRHGLQSMSIGYLVDPSAAMVWRGPMLGKALEQLMYDTQWDNLDYLIVDLPPGTGDVQLTLCQKMPVTGAVIVTTPQDLALLDVRRACEMFTKLNVPILGIVENMSTYHCPHCGHAAAIFGAGGGEKLAQEFALPVLGAVPLHIDIREMTDNGKPPVVQDPNSHYAKVYTEIACKMAAKVSLQTKDYSGRFPKVVIEKK